MSRKGKYILLMEVSSNVSFNFSRRKKRVYLERGLYLYVGSAMGPGGLERRLMRHRRKEKKLKWHIDYLTAQKNVSVFGAFILESSIPEWLIVEKLLEHGAFSVAIDGFGATDSKAGSHLLKYNGKSRDGLVHMLEKIFVGKYLEFNADL
ncbi:MAG: GIY-YIG nuclease family protein [Candidatus Njordarchaeia archaeon]